jgi:hypothetical protein
MASLFAKEDRAFTLEGKDCVKVVIDKLSRSQHEQKAYSISHGLYRSPSVGFPVQRDHQEAHESHLTKFGLRRQRFSLHEGQISLVKPLQLIAERFVCYVFQKGICSGNCELRRIFEDEIGQFLIIGIFQGCDFIFVILILGIVNL